MSSFLGFARAYKIPLLMLIIGIPTIVSVASLKPQPKPTAAEEIAPPKVRIAKAAPKPWKLTVKSQGTVEPKREINLVAEISGRIVETSDKFVSGGFFEHGELLVRIDPRDYQYAVIRAKSRVADAQQLLATEQGRVRQAKREWRNLGNQQANDLFLRKPQLAAAKANLDAARADQTKAELDLERTSITLPFDGRLRKTLVNLGQYVTPGTPIASAYDVSTAEVRLSLTERQTALLDLPLGMARTTDNQPNVTLSGSVMGEAQHWQGKLTRTDASIDTRSRLYYAIAEVNDPYGLKSKRPPLIMGMFVDAAIEGREIDKVVRLPKAALYQSNRIFILDDDNRIIEKSANVLSSNTRHVWLKGNLNEADRVAIDKHHHLKEGLLVTPMTSTQEP